MAGYPGVRPEFASTTMTDVELNTASLGVMDEASTGEVWSDILFHGDLHGHGGGGLMTYPGAVGTMLDHDGVFPVQVGYDAAGVPTCFAVDLDPYGADLDGVRVPVVDHDEDPLSHHDESHGHGHSVDGWSVPVSVELPTGVVVVGDPAGVAEADDTGGLVSIAFPGPGTLTCSVYQEKRIRRVLVATFAPVKGA